MSKVRNYKLREFVKAEKLSKNGDVYTSKGREYAKAGDYLVYNNLGTFIVRGTFFEEQYVAVEQDESDARTFTPAGKTVNEVREFMDNNPDECVRVRSLELKGAGRKGITEYFPA